MQGSTYVLYTVHYQSNLMSEMTMFLLAAAFEKLKKEAEAEDAKKSHLWEEVSSFFTCQQFFISVPAKFSKYVCPQKPVGPCWILYPIHAEVPRDSCASLRMQYSCGSGAQDWPHRGGWGVQAGAAQAGRPLPHCAQPPHRHHNPQGRWHYR